MQNRLDALLEQDKITKEQYDALSSWMESRPDADAGFDEFKAWMESRPDDLPVFGFKGHGGFRGHFGPRFFGGPPCAPPAE